MRSPGSCRDVFCGREEDCAALKGGRCRFPLRARPSMEAAGIDVYRMIAAAGWDVYPAGSGTCANLAGLILVR